MEPSPILLTGFEPYGGRGLNPAYEAVMALDGKYIGVHRIVGVTLPVVNKGLRQRIQEKIENLGPAVLLSLGLWPGETMIRLERVGVNISDFEIPDQDGILINNEPIIKNGNEALFSSLPLKAILSRLLREGIPARISNSAGTFLCNAMLYNALRIIKDKRLNIACGFAHLPYLPIQVAEIIDGMQTDRKLELHQRADLASMELTTIIKAIEISLQTVVSRL
jgi:pyroglutamyl-peptidase